MKKIIASTGLAALGVASLQAAYAPGLTAVQTSKPWSVSAAVRGFYDDNYRTLPANTKVASWGADLNPSASLNFPLEQTYIGLNYSYDLKYYQDRADKHLSSADHVHQASATLSHQFSPHYKLDLSDSFAVAQQPELLAPGYSPLPIFTVQDGNNIMNDGKAQFRGDLTDTLGAELSYDNTVSVWNDRGRIGSTASVLDRMTHLATVDLRWNWLPTTIALLGYQFSYTDYTSSDHPAAAPVNYTAQIRNARSHYAFVGVDQTFTTQISGSIRVGAEFTEYPNAHEIVGLGSSATSPFADASLSYTYNPGSYVKVGINHQRNATYQPLLGGVPLLDTEATSAYAMVNHKLTGKLTGNILGSYQNSNYHVPGGVDKEDNYFNLNAMLSYQINQFLSAEATYNFYRLDSDFALTSYTRNVVFFGVRATY